MARHVYLCILDPEINIYSYFSFNRKKTVLNPKLASENQYS